MSAQLSIVQRLTRSIRRKTIDQGSRWWLVAAINISGRLGSPAWPGLRILPRLEDKHEHVWRSSDEKAPSLCMLSLAAFTFHSVGLRHKFSFGGSADVIDQSNARVYNEIHLRGCRHQLKLVERRPFREWRSRLTLSLWREDLHEAVGAVCRRKLRVALFGCLG